MPNLKEDNPQFPERSSGSLLKTALATTPLTIGVAAATRGIATDGSIKTPREAGIDQAMRHLAQRTYKGPAIPGIEEVNRFMNGESGDVLRQAWKWATHTVDPFTRKKMLGFTEGIDAMTEPEVRSALSQTLSGNESRAMERLWRKFSRNVDLLKAQQSMAGILPAFVSVEDLTQFVQHRTIPLVTEMPSSFSTSVQRIAETLGTKPLISGLTRPEVAAEGFGIWNVAFRADIGDIRLRLPQIVEGMMLEGSDLQTRRIAPDILHLSKTGDVTRMSRTEFFLKEFEESVVPHIGGQLKTERDVQQAIKQLRAKVFGELEATPNVLSTGMTAAQAQREALRGMAVDVIVEEEQKRGLQEYVAGFRKPTDEEIRKLIESKAGREMGLTGGISPKGLSQGRLSTIDWERFYLGPVDYGRRPEQRFREFQATQETFDRLGQQRAGRAFRAADIAGSVAYQNASLPSLRATYIDPSKHGALLERIAMGEGEALIRARRAQLLEFEESTAVKLIEARSNISDFKNIEPGELLGITQTGKTFTLPQGAEITNVRRLTDQVLQVEYMKKHRLIHGGKLFGGVKALALFRSDPELGTALKELNANMASDMLINMDELRKNRSLHKSQMLSAMNDLVTGTWDAAKAGREWTATAKTHEDWIRMAMKTAANELELSPREFGQVFGAVPTVLGDDVAAVKMLRSTLSPIGSAYEKAMLAGIAGGTAEIAYGGPRLEAGVMGSVEPRAFDILRGGALGAQGEDIAAELVQRLAVTNPETIITHQEIGKTLTSMSGGKLGKGLAIFNLQDDFQKFVERGGGILRPGSNMPDIYVPSASVMQGMRPFETITGAQVRGSVADIYHDLAYKTQQFAAKELTSQEFQKQINIAADLLRREYVPAGKGAGAVLRGKVIGSRFLRGVSTMGAGAETASREANVIGITQRAFEDMYDELIQSKLYTKELKELEAMKNRFLAGQHVGGMLSRHPFIGEFSVQPIMMKMVKGSDDLMVLPEIRQNIRFKTALEGEFKEKTLTLGPLVGLAGDKDADAYSAMLVGPRNEEQIRKQILAQDSEFANRYAQHQVRMQLFKAKARGSVGEELIPLKQMIADIEKLSVGQKWIAPLSLEMTSAKQALTTFGQGAASADARFLLEWLEQTPISAKHLTAQEASEGGLQSLMISITDAIRERNSARLEANIASIVKDDTTAAAMLSGNIILDSGSAQELGTAIKARVGPEIRGINVANASRELMRTLAESDSTGMTRHAQLLSGRGARAKINEIAELAAKTAFKTAELPGVFNKVATAVGEVTNKLGAAGRGLIRHHRTIGLGFAGSLAVAATLSSPPTTVGSGQSKIPDTRMVMSPRKAANRMKPEDVMPPQQPVGNPTAPQLVQNQSVRLDIGQPRTNMAVHARLPANANTVSLSAGLSSLGNNTSVNFRDNRRSLHPHEIANKLL